jgi:outer membrane protein
MKAGWITFHPYLSGFASPQNNNLLLNPGPVVPDVVPLSARQRTAVLIIQRRVMKAFGSLVIVLLTVCSVSGQKFGYINTAALLELMPEVETADKQLSAFQEGLIKGGENKVRAFEANYNKYLEDVNNGSLSKVQQIARENSLSEEQNAIAQYEQEVQLQVLQKREELLKPILQRIDKAIQAEGKEGGYTFIFDSSVAGALLYAVDGDDIMEAVKRRLGLQ